MEKLSEAVKVFKRKEDFYLKILFLVPDPPRPLTSKQEQTEPTLTQLRINDFQTEHEDLVS